MFLSFSLIHVDLNWAANYKHIQFKVDDISIVLKINIFATGVMRTRAAGRMTVTETNQFEWIIKIQEFIKISFVLGWFWCAKSDYGFNEMCIVRVLKDKLHLMSIHFSVHPVNSRDSDNESPFQLISHEILRNFEFIWHINRRIWIFTVLHAVHFNSNPL